MKCCIQEEDKDARNVFKSNRSPPFGEKKVSWEEKRSKNTKKLQLFLCFNTADFEMTHHILSLK